LIISKEFRFEASHVLPKHPGKCARLHGHSWVLTVAVEGSVDAETGFVVDYGMLKDLVNREVVEKLDHTHLGYGLSTTGNYNEKLILCRPPFGDTFYPSSENLVVAIGRILQPLIKELAKDVRLYEVTLNETCTSRATWRADA
jgi:6-pyruvoyltetrahydropterin/6-carboxytetrahydropterin synthase